MALHTFFFFISLLTTSFLFFCSGGSGEASLAWKSLRAELGESFVLKAEHFPLSITVSGAKASLRGR